jgi:hypothetical protein
VRPGGHGVIAVRLLAARWHWRLEDRAAWARFDARRAEPAVACKGTDVLYRPVPRALDRTGAVPPGSLARAGGVRRGQLRLTVLPGNRFLPAGFTVTPSRVRPERAK